MSAAGFTLARSLDIIKSWIDLIDDNGWVAREQILGEEARSKVSRVQLCGTTELTEI